MTVASGGGVYYYPAVNELLRCWDQLGYIDHHTYCCEGAYYYAWQATAQRAVWTRTHRG